MDSRRSAAANLLDDGIADTLVPDLVAASMHGYAMKICLRRRFAHAPAFHSVLTASTAPARRLLLPCTPRRSRASASGRHQQRDETLRMLCCGEYLRRVVEVDDALAPRMQNEQRLSQDTESIRARLRRRRFAPCCNANSAHVLELRKGAQALTLYPYRVASSGGRCPASRSNACFVLTPATYRHQSIIDGRP